MRDLVMLAGWLAMLPLAFRRPVVGVMLWVWSAYLSPASTAWGFMATLPLNKLAAAVTILGLLTQSERRRFRPDAIFVTLFAMIALGLLSAHASPSVQDSNWTVYGRLVKTATLCVIIQLIATSRLRVLAVMLAAAAGLGFHGVDEGLKFLASGGKHHVVGNVTLGDNNDFALLVLMVCPILAYVSTEMPSRAVRLGLRVAAALCVVSVVATFSRGGFIGLSAVALGAVAMSRRKAAGLAVAAIATAGLLAFAPAAWHQRIETIHHADQDASFNSRLTTWKMSVLIALDRPLLGGGFYAVQDPVQWARARTRFDLLDAIPTEAPDDTPHAAHSMYFEALADLGFPGLGLFLALLALGFGACGRIRRDCRGVAGLEWAFSLAGMLRLGLIAYAVSGAALSATYFELFYVILATLSATRRLVAEAAQASRQPPPPARLAVYMAASAARRRSSGVSPSSG